MPDAVRFAAAAAALLLAGCDPATPDPGRARFEGVVAATASAFTSPPSRCVFSFLFDDFRVGWRASEPADPARTDKTGTRHIDMAVAPAARGLMLAVELRGSYDRAGGEAAPVVVLRIGDRDFPVQLPDGEAQSEIYQRFEARIPADAETIRIEPRVAFPRPAAGTEAMVGIDSLDLALLAPDECRSMAEEKAAMPPMPARNESGGAR